MVDYSGIKNLKIGITGGCGFLGQRLIKFLTPYTSNIYCLVRNESKANIIKSYNPKLIYGDITDKSSLVQFVKNIDICIHLAALVGNGSVKDYKNINVLGTQKLCEAILENNQDCRFINCSSIAALKINKFLKFEFTNYAKSKKLADEVVEKLKIESGLKSTTIYSGLIYGPGDTKFIPVIIENIQNGKLFFLTGGEKNAPLVYVDDLCELFANVILNQNSIGKKYVGVGMNETGIHDFFKLIAGKLSYPEPSKKLPRQLVLMFAVLLEGIYGLLSIKKSPPLTKRTVDILSISFRKEKYKVDNELSWEPRTNIENGLNNFLKWHFSEHQKKD